MPEWLSIDLIQWVGSIGSREPSDDNLSQQHRPQVIRVSSSNESQVTAEPSTIYPVMGNQQFSEPESPSMKPLQPNLQQRQMLAHEEPFVHRSHTWAKYYLRGGMERGTSAPDAVAVRLLPEPNPPPNPAMPLCSCCGSNSPPYWICIPCGTSFDYSYHYML